MSGALVVQDQPSETSPLLAARPLHDVEPTDGVGPETITGSAGQDEERLEQQPINDDTQKPHEGMPEVKKKLPFIMPALAIGIFLAAADQTIIVTIYGKIGSDLQALDRTGWIATAYFLTLTSFQPLMGKTSDIFGRKACLLTGYTIFGIGCLLCGLAQNIWHLVGARAVAGIGAAGMNTIVSILLSDIMTLRERGTWQGYLNIIFATGSASGAPIGGLLVDNVGWRWAFLCQVPPCLAAMLAVSCILHLPQRDETHWKQKLGRIDFPGAVVLMAATSSLLLALDHGSNVSWTGMFTIVSVSISIPLFVLFVAVETKFAKEPIAPSHIIFSRDTLPCFLCWFFTSSGWIAAIFYVPLYFQAYNGLSATSAGSCLIPSILLSVTGSLAGGFYMKKTGRYYRIAVAAFASMVLGLVVVFLCSGTVNHSAVGIILGSVLSGFGGGVAGTTTLIALIANVSRDDQAVATACSYLFRSLGSVIGISMSATVANQTLRNYLASELPALGLPRKEAVEIADRVRESLQYLRHLVPEVRVIVMDCYASSVNAAFALQIALVAGAAVSGWFIKEKALSK